MRTRIVLAAMLCCALALQDTVHDDAETPVPEDDVVVVTEEDVVVPMPPPEPITGEPIDEEGSSLPPSEGDDEEDVADATITLQFTEDITVRCRGGVIRERRDTKVYCF